MPIGLGIYFAWRESRLVGPEQDRRLRGGCRGAALVGAWLGFHAAADLLALVTAIVGAAAGANLALILLDIARERSVRRRVAEPMSGAAPSRFEAASPGTGGSA